MSCVEADQRAARTYSDRRQNSFGGVIRQPTALDAGRGKAEQARNAPRRVLPRTSGIAEMTAVMEPEARGERKNADPAQTRNKARGAAIANLRKTCVAPVAELFQVV